MGAEDEGAVRACMKEAIEEAKLSLSEGGIPIGSVLMKWGKGCWEGSQYACPKE